MKEFFIPGPPQQNLLFEGFDPNELASDILAKNIDKLFEIILKEYDQEALPVFERDFVNILKRMFGELIYEISEGLQNGFSDFELVFKENLKNMITRVGGAQIGELFGFMAVPNLIPHVKNCYEEYKSYLEEKVEFNEIIKKNLGF